MDEFCVTCNEAVLENALRMTCADCEYVYHLGKCSGVSETTFKTKNDAYKKAWRCPTCRNAKQRGGQTGKQTQESDSDVASMLGAISQKLDSLMPLKEQVNGIEKAVTHLSAQYDEILARINQNENETKQLKKRLEKLEQSKADAEINKLKQEVNVLEWRSRKQNLEIHGISQSTGENLIAKVNEVAKRLDVPELSKSDIVTVHRLPPKSNKIPGIIVRFTNQETRDRWIDNRRKLTRGPDSVYIQENLTLSDRSLLWMTKEWARANRHQYVWYRNGKIFIRKSDGEPALVIASVADLDRMTRQN